MVNFLRAMYLPNQFVYRKEESVPNVFLYQNLDVLKNELITLTPTNSRREIEAYLEQQSAPVDKLDFDEKSYILKVREAYSQAGRWSSESTGVPSVTTTTIEELVKEEPTPQQVTSPLEQVAPASQIAPQVPPTPPQQDLTRPELPAGKTLIAPEQKPDVTPAAPQIQQKAPETPPQEPREQIIKSQTNVRTYKYPKEPQIYDERYHPAMTPDMHTGRRFINLAQEAGRGNIILPIRGERVLKSVNEERFDTDEAQKVKELDILINQIKSKETVQKQIIESQKIKSEEDTKKTSLEEQTRKEKESALRKVQEEFARSEEGKKEAERKMAEEQRVRAEKEARAKEQAMREQERLEKLRNQEDLLRRQKEELIKKQKQEMAAQTPLQPQPIPLQQAQKEDSPTTPNIIWGVVITTYQNNRVPVPSVVVLVRNQRSEVVRAVKTNAQGKFGITTPLINGSYTVEVDKERKSGLNFPVTAIEAKGGPIPTLEITGKV